MQQKVHRIKRRQIVGNRVCTIGSLFPRLEKGRFHPLPVRDTSPITASTALTGKTSISEQTQGVYPPWKQLFRPFPLALVGLAIAVTLWAYGYKLSLYHPHPTPASQASVAKLWDGPRNSSLAAASRLKTESHLSLGSQALWVPSQPLPHTSRALALVFPVCTSSVRFFNSLLPSRSPPPYRFRLA
jgi:hypothetical protein